MPNAPRPTQGQFILAFAVIYLIWGSTYLAIRFTIETLPPFLTAGLRFLCAGILLFAFIRFKERGPWPTLQQWRSALIIGGLLLLGGNGCVVWAEYTVPSGLAALFIATVPLWMVLLEWLWFKGSRPSAGMLAGIAMGLAGVWILTGFGSQSAERLHGPGAAALLVASISWTIGSLHARRVQWPSSIFLATGMQMMAGGVLLMLTGIINNELALINPAAFSFKSIAAFFYLIIFGSLCGFTAYIWLLNHAGVTLTSTYAFVNPVVAVLLGWLLAGEQLTARTASAAALIVLAVGVITFAHKSAPPARNKNNL